MTGKSDYEDVIFTVSKIRELEDICRQAKNDAMKLRRKLEGRNVVTLNQRSQQTNQKNFMQHEYGNNCDYGNEIENVTTVAVTQTEPPQKRGRGRPRKIKDSLELIRGDIEDRTDEDGDNMRFNKRSCNLMNDGEFNNAIYSIEGDELYVKTKTGMLYDINTLQLKGWFNPYLKTNVWIE